MTPRPDSTPSFVVELTEWDKLGPAQDVRLRGCSLAGDMESRRLAETLRDRVDIREGYDGLEITSTSFVGRVDVGPLRIAIGPSCPRCRSLDCCDMLMGYAILLQSRRRDHRPPDTVYTTCWLRCSRRKWRSCCTVVWRVATFHYRKSWRARVAGILIDQVIRQGGVREAQLPCTALRTTG